MSWEGSIPNLNWESILTWDDHLSPFSAFRPEPARVSGANWKRNFRVPGFVLEANRNIDRAFPVSFRGLGVNRHAIVLLPARSTYHQNFAYYAAATPSLGPLDYG
jgi:hypothetical protein